MPCINHPDRPVQCGCIALCSDCRASHWGGCGCKNKKKECKKIECPVEPPNTPEPPKCHLKMEEPPVIKDITEEIVSKLELALEDATSVREKELEEKVRQDDEMLCKLNRSYSAKLAEMRAEQDRLIAEREIIIQQIAEREQKIAEAEKEKEDKKEIKKKIKTIQKKIKETTESVKWDNLSRGRSATQTSGSAVRSGSKPRSTKL